MKNLIIVLVSFFVFIGCTNKPVVPSTPVIKPKEPVILTEPIDIEPVVPIGEPIKEEVIIEDDGLNKIAIIYPSKIVGKYAKSTINTINAFLIYNNQPFEVQAFDTYDENPENIVRELVNLNENGFTKVIALFTNRGFDIFNTIEESKNANIYFPLLNKENIVTEYENFIFGGISYEEQLVLLETLSNGRNTMFYRKGGYTETKLKDLYLNTFSSTGLIKEIERKQNNFKYIMKDERMTGNTILLNTYPVKSSIILSQLTAFEINPYNVLSTQINYNPILVKLTQSRDRKSFFIANSIAEVDSFIEDYTKLLGSDITYNWVDYSSLVGVNYLLNDNESEVIKTKVIDNQVDYEPTLYKSTSYGFQKLLTN